jgi:NADPH:quinone reductase-like Zn-dependent oxidoreductase
MALSFPIYGLQLRSLIKKTGELEVSLAKVEVLPPAPAEVVVRIEASPLNPSDLGLLFGAADLNTARQTGTAEHSVITADVAPNAMPAMAGRLDLSLPVGNEGAGIVVAAGQSQAAQALLGKAVAVIGGAMYAQYRTVNAQDCLLLPEGATPADGASCFVNPLTALGMVETMRIEGHKALVHTAAASNLGQMLNKICLHDKIGLVNIVRNAAQEEMLRALGADYVCNSAAPSFKDDLTQALIATQATLAFDAIGGGKLAGQILSCMEAAINQKTPSAYSRYGSSVHKQVYIYGGLDPKPTEFGRSFGMAYGIGGWLIFPFLNKIGPAETQRLKERISAELKTTFASHYAAEISLPEVLQLDKIAVYNKRATGEKYLINPSKT